MDEQTATPRIAQLFVWLALAGVVVGLISAFLLVVMLGGEPDSEWGLMGVYLGITSLVSALPLGLFGWFVHHAVVPDVMAWSVFKRWVVGAGIAIVSLIVNWGIPQSIIALLNTVSP